MDELLCKLSTTQYISGETLCESLGMTRAAIWKRIEKLRSEGYHIQAGGKRGYRLELLKDSLLPGYVQRELDTRWAGRGILAYQRTVSSTNTLLKELAYAHAPKGSVFLCENQTLGRGRLGRAWDAAEGENLLHSLLLRPTLPVELAPLLTLTAALAMAQAIEDILPPLKAGIKWPNDIVLGGRKCVGILSEMAADMDGIQFVILGVGVNVNQPSFEGELAGKATSLWLEAQRGKGEPASAKDDQTPIIDRRKLLCAYLLHVEHLMDALEKDGLPAILQAYTLRSVTLGAQVRVFSAEGEWAGFAEAIDETGALLVRDEQGTLKHVLSGDVSVRGVMGYVNP